HVGAIAGPMHDERGASAQIESPPQVRIPIGGGPDRHECLGDAALALAPGRELAADAQSPARPAAKPDEGGDTGRPATGADRAGHACPPGCETHAVPESRILPPLLRRELPRGSQRQGHQDERGCPHIATITQLPWPIWE